MQQPQPTLTQDGSPVNPPTLEVLAEAVAELRRQVDELLRQVQDTYREPEDCRKHQCSYYEHYLAYGGPDLTHEGFHAAETTCLQVQKDHEAYLDKHGKENPALERLCKFWEQKVRA